MKKHIIVIAITTLFPLALSTAQFVLQPWVQVFGTVPGQQLGAEVRGITPTSNLPYKASISSFGSTGLYTLQTPNDTGAQRTFFGGNMLTGDLNGDGYTDVVVRRGGTITTVDTVLVYWGNSTGIDTLNPLRILGENPGDGFVPECIGDVNNDGYEDLITGAIGYPYPYGWGKVYFFFGPNVGSIPSKVLVGDTISFHIGSKCRVADLNNDGNNDLIIQGQVSYPSGNYRYHRIYWGLPDSLNLSNKTEIRGSTDAGGGLACFDANGDGIADLLWTNRDGQGDWVYIHYGGVGFDTIASLKLEDPGVANFGNSIINAGDMNGDGYNDILVAAYRATNTSGFVFVFGGGPQVDGTFDAAVGMDSDSDFGVSVSSVGDVSGDGLADIIVGAPAYDFGISNKGYWGIFKGDSAIRVTNVKEGERLPTIVALHQAYPNPFNPITTIKYDLTQSAHVLLQVFTVLGQQVVTLQEGNQLPGTHSSVFDGTGLASGVYLYRLTARTQDGRTYTDTKTLTLIK